MIGLGAAALAIEAFGLRQSTAVDASPLPYSVTADLNLRSGPGLQYSVIRVMPKGSTVVLTGKEENGFYSVTFEGTAGWAHRDYVVADPPVVDGVGFAPIFIGNARTTAALNLRSGPSTTEDVLMVIPSGTWVEISNAERLGFRFVRVDGRPGWAFDDYLSWPGDGEPVAYLTTTTALNFREKPSTSARILAVLPEGSRVLAGVEMIDGFRQIVLEGTTGWAYDAYLR
jgi:D-alanyl-D-alanine carboxypeptidase